MGDSPDARRCTKCRQPVRGHVRQCGTNCPNTPGNVADETGANNNPLVPAPLFEQLVTQIKQLNANMQYMVATQTAILRELRTKQVGNPVSSTADYHRNASNDDAVKN